VDVCGATTTRRNKRCGVRLRNGRCPHHGTSGAAGQQSAASAPAPAAVGAAHASAQPFGQQPAPAPAPARRPDVYPPDDHFPNYVVAGDMAGQDAHGNPATNREVRERAFQHLDEDLLLRIRVDEHRTRTVIHVRDEQDAQRLADTLAHAAAGADGRSAGGTQPSVLPPSHAAALRRPASQWHVAKVHRLRREHLASDADVGEPTADALEAAPRPDVYPPSDPFPHHTVVGDLSGQDTHGRPVTNRQVVARMCATSDPDLLLRMRIDELARPSLRTLTQEEADDLAAALSRSAAELGVRSR
jgi:hypothetical protein